MNKQMHISGQFSAMGMATSEAEFHRARGFNAVVVELDNRDVRVFFWSN
jgi:hypothetical protein